MNGFGARAYKTVAVDSGVKDGDPHRLILMLYDGALAAINEARGHMAGAQVDKKGAAISKAIRIIDEGLKTSLDRNAGGQLALRLLDLYDYSVMRLLQANLRNDVAALAEVSTLLADLRDAWSRIRPTAASAPVAPTVGAAPGSVTLTPATGNAPAPAFIDGTNRGPVRRVTVSA